MNPEFLLSHAGSLRALARGLLGDEHSAEDVLQDAWVNVLSRPHPSIERPAAWLRTMVRSLSLRRLRSEERRTARERLATDTTPGTAPAVEDLVERKALLRSVVDACLELEEPYQTVLYLRYFEDLGPAQIGRQLGRSQATVKSQLNRGLARMRERLDREASGGRPAWAVTLAHLAGTHAGPVRGPGNSTGNEGRSGQAGAAPTAGWPSAGSALQGLAKALVVVMHIKFLLALTAASSLAGLIWWSAKSAAALSPPSPAPMATRAQAALTPGVASGETHAFVAAPEVGTEEASERAAVVADAARPEWEPDPMPFESVLLAWVEDPSGHPIAGASVYLGPDGTDLNEVGETDTGGNLSLRWSMRTASTDMVFAIRTSDNRWSGLRRFAARAGAVHIGRVTLQSANFQALPVRALASTAGSVQLTFVEAPANSGGVRFEVEENEYGSAWLRSAPEPIELEDPLDTWGFDLPRHHRSLAASRRVPALSGVGGTFSFKIRRGSLINLGGFDPDDETPRANLSGHVYDSFGDPAREATVALFIDDELAAIERTDDAGFYELANAPVGRWTLVAGGGKYGRATWETEVEAPYDLYQDLKLLRGIEVFGTLTDVGGMPLADWTVELESVAGQRALSATTVVAADGGFSIPNAEPSIYRLFLRPPGSWTSPPVLVVENVQPGQRLTLVAKRPAGELRLEVLDDLGEGARVQVRLWHELSGRGLAVGYEGEGRYKAQDLPAGRYSVEVSAHRYGWYDLGEVWIGEAETLDLGTLALEPFAMLTWPQPTAAQAGTYRDYLLLPEHAPVPTLALEGRVQGEAEIELAAGSYVLVVARDGAPPVAYPFSVRPGETHELDFGDAPALPVTHSDSGDAPRSEFGAR